MTIDDIIKEWEEYTASPMNQSLTINTAKVDMLVKEVNRLKSFHSKIEIKCRKCGNLGLLISHRIVKPVINGVSFDYIIEDEVIEEGKEP